ncbi:MAG: FxLYD domain-containing protein [Candidatus Binataceae bacterium]
MSKSTCLLLIAAIAFVGFVFYSLTHVEPVEVMQTHLEHRGDKVFVEGEVKNTGSKTRAVDLEVHYYDHDGRPLGQDVLKLTGLHAGSVEAFKSPPHELNAVSEFSIYLNHGRDPYGN